MSILPYIDAAKMVLAQTVEQGAGGGGEGTGATPPPGGGLGSMIPMLIAFAAIFYFLMLRPQQKRDKERREMLGALAKGDAVVTTGGVCGSIVNLSESHVVLQVDKDVTMEFVRSAVAHVVKKKDGEEA